MSYLLVSLLICSAVCVFAAPSGLSEGDKKDEYSVIESARPADPSAISLDRSKRSADPTHKGGSCSTCGGSGGQSGYGGGQQSAIAVATNNGGGGGGRGGGGYNGCPTCGYGK